MLDFFKDIAKSLLRALGMYAVAFGFGTAVGVVVCLVYGLPLVLSLFFGLLVIGLALALAVSSSWW